MALFNFTEQSNLYNAMSFFSPISDSDLALVPCNAVKWIVSNQKLYKVPSSHRDIMSALERSLGGDTADQISALKAFYSAFLNNPFVYENLATSDDLKKHITADSILCYCVCVNEIPFPLGIVSDFLIKDEETKLISAFMEHSADCFDSLLTSGIDVCATNANPYETEKKIKRKFLVKIAIATPFLFLALSFVISRLILGVDWKSISYFAKSTSNPFVFLGFLTEKAYGISHNSYLGVFCVLLAAFWFLRILFIISPYFCDLKKLIIYTKRTSFYKKFARLFCSLTDILSRSDGRRLFLSENSSDIEFLYFSPTDRNSPAHLIGKLQKSKLCKNTNTNKRSLPSKLSLSFMLIFMALTAALSLNLSNPQVNNVADEISRNISFYIDSTIQYTYSNCSLSEATPVYCTESPGSPIVYHLGANEEFRLMGTSHDNPAMKRIKIPTQYGYVEGFISSASLRYHPHPSKNAELKQIPINYISHSANNDKKLKNLYDNNSRTSWHSTEDMHGTGEYIDIFFHEASAVKTIMIQPGLASSSWFYKANGRPARITLYLTGESDMPVNLNDTPDKQYIHFNNPISADHIGFRIDEIIEGSINKNAYITELAVYSEN